jgi:hypothetical protein
MTSFCCASAMPAMASAAPAQMNAASRRIRLIVIDDS